MPGGEAKVNNAVLTNLSRYMARHGLSEGAFVYGHRRLAYAIGRLLAASGRGRLLPHIGPHSLFHRFRYHSFGLFVVEGKAGDEEIAPLELDGTRDA